MSTTNISHAITKREENDRTLTLFLLKWKHILEKGNCKNKIRNIGFGSTKGYSHFRGNSEESQSLMRK